MRLLLTGGAGDLARVLAPQLLARGDTVLRLDIRPPADENGLYLPGSITDRAVLAEAMAGVDCVVHIAAWHGIHEVRGEKDVFDFWDVNVSGTFHVYEAAARAGVANVVFLSSTSAEEPQTIYGHSKVLGEEVARGYALREGINSIILRPRAFIPHWNRQAYDDFVQWAAWFWPGAVHITDVAQAVRLSTDTLARRRFAEPPVLVVDGAYDYSAGDLAGWDADGPGSTFRRTYPGFEEMVRRHGLDPTVKPSVYEIGLTREVLGYEPGYSLANLLAELARYGTQGPPPPWEEQAGPG